MTRFASIRPSLSRDIFGSAVALSVLAVTAAIMFAFRSHLDTATVALVFVIPVVVGVVSGGGVPGVVAVVAGFFLYDFVFIRPYYTLLVGSPQHWLALVVYVIVVSLLVRVVQQMRIAQQDAGSREADAARLLQVSEVLIGDRPLPELLSSVASIVRETFDCESVVISLPHDNVLEVAVTAGRELTPAELERVMPSPGVRSMLTRVSQRLDGRGDTASSSETIVLSAPGRPIGLLALIGNELSPSRRALATVFANNIAIAIERAQLREQAVRIHILEEVDRLRGALVGAVSHDLRTPLATIKASASTMLDPDAKLGDPERHELLSLIDEQSDRLARLVTNLLDMSRIETGALVVNRQELAVGDVIEEAIGALRPLVASGRIEADVAEWVPHISADYVLVQQVLVNLLENALRYAPQDTTVRVTARVLNEAGLDDPVADSESAAAPGRPGRARVAPTQGQNPRFVEICVIDRGPGISPAEFERRGRPGPRPAASGAQPGGAGVGLAIARAFVEAHGGGIHASTPPGGGTCIAFSLPAVPIGGSAPGVARAEPKPKVAT